MAQRSRLAAPVKTLAARAYGSGGVELFIVTGDSGVWRNRRDDDVWSGWTRESSSPDSASVPPSAVRERSHFSVDERGALLYDHPGIGGSYDLGGDIAGGAAHVGVVAHESGSLEVFAIWAGAAIMHRRFEREWSQWDLVDLLAAPAGPYRLLRARDFVTLAVRGSGLIERMTEGGGLEWVAEGPGAQLIVDLPPQHIAETVLTTTTSSAARLAGPSTLRFPVATDPVPISTAGVLRAMRMLKLDKASRLELPWRLLLALEPQARCVHRQSPAPGGSIAEMWHTRVLGEKSAYAAIRPFESLPLELPFATQTPLKDKVTQIAEQGASHPTQTVPTDRLILSACGAWLSAAATWPDLQWTQKTAMARDYYVRVVQPGFLFPFGHRAALVATYEREFDTAAPAVAGLRESLMLVIAEPVRDDYGIRAPHERAFPFQRIEIEPRLVETVDEPQEGAGAFWPARGGRPLLFSIRGTSGTEVIEMELPLLFTDGSHPEGLDAVFARGPAGSGPAARPTAQVGRSMPLAMRSLHEPLPGASQHVRSLTFGGAPISGDRRFHPKITGLEVELPAVNQLMGVVGALPATLSHELLQSTPESPLDVLLEIQPLRLNFGSAKTGAVASPNVSVDRISRTRGPMLAQLPSNPAEMFRPDAKLLGVIPLAALISQITESSRPIITWTDGTNPAAIMRWTQTLTRALPPFSPDAGCQVDLRITSSLSSSQQPFVVTHGVVSNFTLRIPGERALVTLGFKHVTFHVETGALPVTTFEIATAALGENLKFIQKLSQYIPRVGASGPKIDVTTTAIKAAYVIAIPTPIALGAFTLQNLQLRAGITLSLVNAPVTIDFAFGSRANPFLVTATGFGGGGYIELGIGAGEPDAGLQRFVGGIEFGASVAMSFGVAEGEVHVFGGVVFTKVRTDVQITGYLRIGGMVRVLGLISVSVELTVSLTYDPGPNHLTGEAKLVIAIDLTFWSTSVEIRCTKTFKGSDLLLADSEFVLGPAPGASVADSLGPIGDSFPWRTYCHAFADE